MLDINASPTPPSRGENIDVRSWIDSPAARLVGVGVTMAATLVAFRDAVSRAFFKSMNKGEHGAFADLQHTRDAAINAITKPVCSGNPVPDAMDKVHAVVKRYDQAYLQRRKLLGIHGVFDEMKALKRHQWMEVLFTAGAVASVAVGAIIAIASGRDVVRKQDRLEYENGKNGPEH